MVLPELHHRLEIKLLVKKDHKDRKGLKEKEDLMVENLGR